jgi:hypothetical protein
VKTDSGVLSWQTAGYFEIIALNAPASSKKRMFASGQELTSRGIFEPCRLTSAISGGAQSARRLLTETYTRRNLSMQAA